MAIPENGDGPATSVLDYKTANEVLENYERDGLDVRTLLNSKTNGGLTYELDDFKRQWTFADPRAATTISSCFLVTLAFLRAMSHWKPQSPRGSP